jgi:hypothetical protein
MKPENNPSILIFNTISMEMIRRRHLHLPDIRLKPDPSGIGLKAHVAQVQVFPGKFTHKV